MRYTRKFFFKDLAGFFLLKDNLCIYSKNSLNFFNDKFEVINSLELDTYNNFKVIDDLICCSNSETFYLIKNCEIIISRKGIQLFSFDSNFIYCVGRENNFFNSFVIRIKNLEEISLINTNSSYPINIVNNNILSILKNNKLFCHVKYNNNLLWQYNVEDYFNSSSTILEGRVLVLEDRIVFFAHTEDWSKYATFVIDAQTGVVLNNPKETIFGGKMYLFDSFLWQKKDKGFAKMNPKTFEITHYDLSKELPTEKIENITMAYYEGLIAISAKPNPNAIRSLVIVFDTITEKIVWKQEILKDESKENNNENRCQIQDIQMNKNTIAVFVAGGDLYVFEKDEII